MLKYFINSIGLLFFAISFSQNAAINDSIIQKQRYGLRVGVEVSKPARSLFDADYRGLELVGDYRISKRFYLAAELGTEEKTTDEDQYSFTTSGNYIKAGFDYNVYENWYGLENMIHAGLRYSFGAFSQTLNSYAIYNTDSYWSEGGILGDNPAILQEYKGLTANWIEVVLGFKAEVLNNIYLGASVRINRLISDTSGSNFPNLWIPGFNKVTDGSAFGVGYTYSIAYFIPLYQKADKTKKESLNK